MLIHNQFGFRKGHSTDYAIIQLLDKITESFANKEHIIGVLMDLSKAFDTIDHDILIYKLKRYGIQGIALSWIRDYLTNRKQYVLFQSSESPKSNVLCGVPQGSILGPLLFLIYINDIIYSSPLLSFILIADDTNIFYSHKNFHSLITTLNSELSKVSSWFKCNKLSLNIAKTKSSALCQKGLNSLWPYARRALTQWESHRVKALLAYGKTELRPFWHKADEIYASQTQ